MNNTQQPISNHWIGIDISKKQLDLAIERTDIRLPATLPNSEAGMESLLEVLSQHPEFKIIFESTGGYEKPLLLFLQRHQITAVRVNPSHTRAFGRAQGLLAKTDKIDASLLARYGNTFEPKASAIIDEDLDEIRDMISYRRHLHEQLHREKMQIEHSRGHTVTSMAKRRIASLEKQIKKLTADIILKAKSSDAVARQLELLTEVKGVAELTAITLLSAMPELGTLSRKQAAALAGVAPMNCDSGSMRGTRKIKGGRIEIRKAIYMSALVASKRNPVLREFYENLVARGKAKKVALTAVMRKLIIHLNSLMRNHLKEVSTAA